MLEKEGIQICFAMFAVKMGTSVWTSLDVQIDLVMNPTKKKLLNNCVGQ